MTRYLLSRVGVICAGGLAVKASLWCAVLHTSPLPVVLSVLAAGAAYLLHPNEVTDESA